MRDLKIFFTTDDKIFFVNESKQLEFYSEEGHGKRLFNEMFGYEEEFKNWSSNQLSEMVSNGLYTDDVKLFELWFNDKQGLFEKFPELFDYVEIDKCFSDLESNGNSKSVISFIIVLENLTSREYNKEYEYVFQCHSIVRKLKKKEQKEAEAQRLAKRTIFDDISQVKQTRYLEQLINDTNKQIKELDFTFEPRIELKNKKAL